MLTCNNDLQDTSMSELLLCVAQLTHRDRISRATIHSRSKHIPEWSRVLLVLTFLISFEGNTKTVKEGEEDLGFVLVAKESDATMAVEMDGEWEIAVDPERRSDAFDIRLKVRLLQTCSDYAAEDRDMRPPTMIARLQR